MEQNLELGEKDFCIHVKPIFNKKNVWSGDVDVTAIYPPKAVLTTEAYAGIDVFVKMMVSSVAVMEIDTHVREAIHRYVAEHYPEDFEIMLEAYNDDVKMVDIEYTDGNVIKLNFKKDTE